MSDEEIYVCPDCGAEIREGVEKCPSCGLELIWEIEEVEEIEGAEEEELLHIDREKMMEERDKEKKYEKAQISKAQKKIDKLERLIYWAEKCDMKTTGIQDVLSKSKEELKVGDWSKSMKNSDRAMKMIKEPLIKALKNSVLHDRKEHKTDEIFGGDVSDAFELMKKAKMKLDKGDIFGGIDYIKRYRKKLEEID
ncbi:MAG: zinc-ribbon domain-containing protein [Thermoplasmata archaeon]